jgi:hypothetical protein
MREPAGAGSDGAGFGGAGSVVGDAGGTVGEAPPAVVGLGVGVLVGVEVGAAGLDEPPALLTIEKSLAIQSLPE